MEIIPGIILLELTEQVYFIWRLERSTERTEIRTR